VPTPEPTIPSLGQDRRETILAYVAGLNLPQERINQLAARVWQRYGYSTLDTSRGEYTDNLTAWQETVQQETGLTDLVAEEDRTDFSVDIERRVCLTESPGDIKIGFVVNPDGSFRQDPVLLRSSGYSDLNQKALELVRQYEPQGADGIKAYTVTVETGVDYGPNDCLEAPQQPSATKADT
jgi:TonB family protein